MSPLGLTLFRLMYLQQIPLQEICEQMDLRMPPELREQLARTDEDDDDEIVEEMDDGEV